MWGDRLMTKGVVTVMCKCLLIEIHCKILNHKNIFSTSMSTSCFFIVLWVATDDFLSLSIPLVIPLCNIKL